MPVFAAVDIGSNSVRLSIAELRRGRLVALHQDREVTRLGEGVFRDGNLDLRPWRKHSRFCVASIVRYRVMLWSARVSLVQAPCVIATAPASLKNG